MTERHVSSREIRRRMNGTQLIVEKAVPAIDILLHNDRVSRDKILALEARLVFAERVHDAFVGRTLWARLRWILRGP